MIDLAETHLNVFVQYIMFLYLFQTIFFHLIPNEQELCLLGDVIVYINDICCLGTTHADVVKLFQSVLIGQSITLVLCRGYPLPFDPEDPSGASAGNSLTPIGMEHHPMVVNGRSSYNHYLEYLSLSSHLPSQALAQPGAPHPGDTHLDGSSLPLTNPGSAPTVTPRDDNVSMVSSGATGITGGVIQGAELLTVTMVKRAEGFGFTIADSPTGQRVKQVGCYSCVNLLCCTFCIVYSTSLSVSVCPSVPLSVVTPSFPSSYLTMFHVVQVLEPVVQDGVSDPGGEPAGCGGGKTRPCGGAAQRVSCRSRGHATHTERRRGR